MPSTRPSTTSRRSSRRAVAVYPVPGSHRRRQPHILRIFPRGRRLPEHAWLQRHLGLTVLLWLHVPGLIGFALYRGYSAQHAAEACSPLVVLAGLALVPQFSRLARSSCVALGLVGASSVLVELSGGAIEAHFHYFVVIAFLTLYQEWAPFLIAVAFVLFEHGIVGVLYPSAVYNHGSMAGMNEHPWKWAFIHAGFVLAASFANLLAWRLTEQEALHDSLTELPNRALFLECLTHACDQRNRGASAVLVIDLDNFKDANDGLGHETGDQLLVAIAGRLRGVIRHGDIVGRIGGDEFGVVLHDIADLDAGLRAARRYLAVFDEPFAIAGISLSTSASIGLGLNADRSCSAVELTRNADLAMYDAKRAGGGQVSQYRPDMHDVVVKRAELESELRGALEREEFVVHYQPLVDVTSGDIVGAEALVRWQHPTRGLIPPSDFIPTAEHSGLILPLGEWVLRTACAQTTAWHEAHPDRRPLKMSVNLSPRQLADQAVIEVVVEALRDSGLTPEYLCLEITEGALIKDFDGALPKLRALKTMGVTLALDDFGTGYSSLSYLRQLPVDSLKIDRSFVTDLTAGTEHHIVLAIIDLAHALGMSVTAEGVETEEQLAILRAMSADVAQGYLLGRPLPREQLTRLLAARGTRSSWQPKPIGI